MRKKLRDDMARLGVEQDGEHCFGRPRIIGVPVFAITERFAAGEVIGDLAFDFGISSWHANEAIRFALLYPKSDLPSFWKGKP